MNNKLYAVNVPAQPIGDGTIQALIEWLEKMVNLLVPANGIDYWHANIAPLRERKNQFSSTDLLPRDVRAQDGPHHVGVYVTDGKCEGNRIEILLYHRDDTYKHIASIKTFGPDEESWKVASVITTLMNYYLIWETMPVLLDMHAKLPRKYKSYPLTSEKEVITITATAHTFEVKNESGTVYESLDFFELGTSAHWRVEAYLKDWITVLTANEAQFRVEQCYVHEDNSVPHYLFTTRVNAKNVEEANLAGWFVIPPNDNHRDTSLQFGPFYRIQEAVNEARGHLTLTKKLNEQKAA